MNASELPDDFKKEMLRRIRDQIGSTEFDRLVHAVGRMVWWFYARWYETGVKAIIGEPIE